MTMALRSDQRSWLFRTVRSFRNPTQDRLKKGGSGLLCISQAQRRRALVRNTMSHDLCGTVSHGANVFPDRSGPTSAPELQTMPGRLERLNRKPAGGSRITHVLNATCL